MAPAHEAPFEGDHRQVRAEALERGVAARPFQAVQEHVRARQGAQELAFAEAREHGAVPCEVHARPLERRLQALEELALRLAALGEADEHELAVAHGLGDARIDVVVPGQVLRQRLSAPEHRCTIAQSQGGAVDRIRLLLDRLGPDPEARQPHQLLRIVGVRAGGLHQVAGDEGVDRRHPGGVRMSPRGALDRGQTLGRELDAHGVHADLRIDQDVRRVGEDALAPGIDARQALMEAVAEPARLLGAFVLGDPRIAPDHFEA